MSKELKKVAVEEMHASHALQAIADALPALGIVAAVLGVIKTMASIDQPPSVLGGMIGGALVGTFLGILLAYGMMGPMAARLKGVVDEDCKFYEVIRAVIVSHLHGNAPAGRGRGRAQGRAQPLHAELPGARGGAAGHPDLRRLDAPAAARHASRDGNSRTSPIPTAPTTATSASPSPPGRTAIARLVCDTVGAPRQPLRHRPWRRAALDDRPGGRLRRAVLPLPRPGPPRGHARPRLPLHRPGPHRPAARRRGPGDDRRPQRLLRPHRGLRRGRHARRLRRLHPPLPRRQRRPAGRAGRTSPGPGPPPPPPARRGSRCSGRGRSAAAPRAGPGRRQQGGDPPGHPWVATS